jgi:hypothetical protein
MRLHAPSRRKTWLKLKRGLITDPEHRRRMGECIWLFGYMLDNAEWESGKVHGWKDRVAAEDMDMPVATVRHQRRKLQEEGYISVFQKRYGLTITIHRYVNPRQHADDALNVPEAEEDEHPLDVGGTESQGDNTLAPLEPVNEAEPQGDNESDNPLTPLDGQGDNEGDNNGGNALTPLLFNPHDHISHKPPPPADRLTDNSEAGGLFREWESSAGPITEGIARDLIDLAAECEVHRRKLPPDSFGGSRAGYTWVQDAIVAARRSKGGSFGINYVAAIIKRWLIEGYGPEAESVDRKGRDAEAHDEWLNKQRQAAKEAIRKARRRKQ